MPQHSALPLEAPVASAPGSSPGVSLWRELIPLRAVFGQDEANHGTMRYPVDSDGLVRVPLEAVAYLTGNGGFAMPITRGDAISAGMVRLHHDNANGCSYGGRGYLRDENGDVVVPAEAAGELLAHGFVPMPQEALAPKPSKLSPSARLRKG